MKLIKLGCSSNPLVDFAKLNFASGCIWLFYMYFAMFSNIYEMMLDIGLNSRVVLEQLMEHKWLFMSFKKQVPFMDRKGYMSMNIFVVYDFNMCLTFVLLVGKGSMHGIFISMETFCNSSLKFSQRHEDLTLSRSNINIDVWFPYLYLFL